MLKRKESNPEYVLFCEKVLNEFSKVKPDYKAISVALHNPLTGLEPKIARNASQDRRVTEGVKKA